MASFTSLAAGQAYWKLRVGSAPGGRARRWRIWPNTRRKAQGKKAVVILPLALQAAR
jgi:hypothetical protein